MKNVDESFLTYAKLLKNKVLERFRTFATNNPGTVKVAKGAGSVAAQTAAITALSNIMSNPNDPNNPAQKKKTKIDDYKPTSVKPGDNRVVEPETLKQLRNHVEHGDTMRKLVEFYLDKNLDSIKMYNRQMISRKHTYSQRVREMLSW